MSDTTGMFVLTNLRMEINQLREKLAQTEAERDLYAAQLQGQQATSDIGWLIGWQRPDCPPVWMKPDATDKLREWTIDSTEGLVFASKDDAERFLATLRLPESVSTAITEHKWV